MRISDWSSDVCSSDLLDRHDKRRPPVRLLKIDENGAEHVVKSVAAADWGDFLRYRYLRFDFSDVRDPGIYVLSFGDTRTAERKSDVSGTSVSVRVGLGGPRYIKKKKNNKDHNN